MKNIYLFALLFMFIFSSSCNTSDDGPLDIRYTIEDLEKIHGNASKTWKVENFYQNFETKELSEYNDCYKDDVFVFFKDNNDVEVQLGETRCVSNSANEEFATLTYNFYEIDGKFFLNVSRAEANGNDFRNRFFLLGLEELSENRMLFAAGERGSYGKTLIFISE